MRKLLALSAVAMLMLSCSSRIGKDPSETVEIDNLSSFAVFLRNFTSDVDYQLAHTRFPLGTLTGTYKRDANAPNGYLPVSLTEEMWALKEIDDFVINTEWAEGGFTQLSPDKVRYFEQGTEVGYYTKCIFERIDGEWYLTEGDWSDSDVGYYHDVLPIVESLNKEFRMKYSHADFVPYVGKAVEGEWPETSLRVLTREDLAKYDKKQLRLMRNEIFARHGLIFKSRDLNDYFYKTRWYAPLFSDVTSRLSDLELANIKLILAVESER